MMKIDIKIPAMGESISQVTIGKMIASNGAIVELDEEILELETDKVNQVIYAPSAGKLELSVKEGDQAAIGEIIGSIEVQKSREESGKVIAKNEQKPLEKSSEEEGGQPTPLPQPSSSGLRISKESFLEDVRLKETLTSTTSEESLKEKVEGGTKERLEKRVPLSKIRKVIAERLVESLNTTAMLTTFNEIDMTHIIELRDKYKEQFLKKHGVKLGFMSFFVQAVTKALKEYPIFNAYLEKDEIVYRQYYDIGIAIGTDKGVIVPVLRDSLHLSFSKTESMIEAYANAAKNGKLKADDLQGAGFTITNGGVYGSLLSTPILSPKQSGILGMHKIEKRPVIINDEICIRSMMYVALSYDHRLADGKEAVSFLVVIKNFLEDPSRMLLDI